VDPTQATRLVVAIVHVCDVQTLVKRLIALGCGATRLDAHGGFLRTERSVVLVATSDAQVATVAATIRATCPRRTEMRPPAANDGTLGLAVDYGPEPAEVGGALILTMPIERVEYLGQAVPLAAGGARGWR
jgi:uncharacterized protein YaaQ